MTTMVKQSLSLAPLPVCDRLAGLRAVVLLGGTVRPGRLSAAIGRPIFALPLDARRSILDYWRQQTAALGRSIARPDLPVRVMVDRNSPETKLAPAATAGVELAPFQLERDPQDYRGTGGVLRDLAGSYEKDDLLLVANAAQVLVRSLSGCAIAMAERASEGAEVVVADHEDGTPSGLMLVRCSVLSLISETGFVDMKEQALPMIARSHRVGVAHFPEPTGLPIRSLAQYVQALRWHALQDAGKSVQADPFAENLEHVFNIVEHGATVDANARLHDSVVLAGGVVEAGATLVQSVVCPGGRVRRGDVVVDRVVAAGRRRNDE
jgi:mannose-1-phosphate guanylyltransferase